jgi:hypothetical protein
LFIHRTFGEAHREGATGGEDEEEGEEERSGSSNSMDSIRGLRKELAAAVTKIFELREIIRNLEQQLDSRDRAARVGSGH